VLIYLPADDTAALLSAVASAFPRAAVAVYEQILPGDAFGRMMVANLAERGLALASYDAYPDCEAQARRLLRAGFSASTVGDMNVASAMLIPAAALAASARVERLDEVEQWTMMQAHYCLAVAVKDGEEAGADVGGDDGAAAAGDSGAAPNGAGGASWYTMGRCSGPLAAVLLRGPS